MKSTFLGERAGERGIARKTGGFSCNNGRETPVVAEMSNTVPGFPARQLQPALNQPTNRNERTQACGRQADCQSTRLFVLILQARGQGHDLLNSFHQQRPCSINTGWSKTNSEKIPKNNIHNPQNKECGAPATPSSRDDSTTGSVTPPPTTYTARLRALAVLPDANL